MQDALLIYFMITNMRHAGGFRFAAHLFQSARAQCMAVWFAMGRNWNTVVAIARLNMLSGNLFSGRTCNARGGGTRQCASAVAAQSDWLQALTRLETYVVSMR